VPGGEPISLYVPDEQVCGRGGLPDRYHPIEAAVEALAECPSLPPGTGCYRIRTRHPSKHGANMDAAGFGRGGAAA
jgi:hypothetical protein